jgi:hypothetical protein
VSRVSRSERHPSLGICSRDDFELYGTWLGSRLDFQAVSWVLGVMSTEHGREVFSYL